MARTKKKSPTLKKKKTGQSKGTNGKKKEENEAPAGTGPSLVWQGETEGGQDWLVEASPFGSVEASIEVAWQGNGELYLVAGVDLSPVDIGVGYNPQAGELQLGGEVGIPGDLLSLGGGFVVDTHTGEITGVSGSLGVAGVEIELEVSGPNGCLKTFTMTVFGIGFSNVLDECDIEPEPEPSDEDENEDWEEEEEDTGWMGSEGIGFEIVAICNCDSAENKAYRATFPWRETFAATGRFRLVYKTFYKGEFVIQFWRGGNPNFSLMYRDTRHSSTSKLILYLDVPRKRKTYPNGLRQPLLGRCSHIKEFSGEYGGITKTKNYEEPCRITALIRWEGGEIDRINLPTPAPPKPPKPPQPLIPPQPKMNSNCCKLIIEQNEDILKLLKAVSVVTGKVEAGEGEEQEPEPIYPLELEQVVDNKVEKFSVNNLFEFMQASANPIGYKKNPVHPIVLTMGSQEEGGQDEKFRYGSIGELQVDIAKVLAPHKVLYGNGGEGYAISKNLLIPGAEGYDFTKDYLGIYTRQFSAIDNHGFSAPIVAKVQDANAAKEGDQTVELQINSLEAAIQTLLELAIENGGDIDTQTNILVRISYLLSRTFVLLSRLWHRATAILIGLGIPTDSSVETLDVEFDPFAKRQFKGFGPDSPKGRLDLHEEDTTEKLLPDLLQMSKIQISVEKAKPKDTVHKKLIQLLYKKKE